MAVVRNNLLGLTRAELRGALVDNLGLQPFRAGQVWSWVHAKGASDFGAMTNLRHLDLHNNLLRALPESLCELRGLTHFVAGGNQLVHIQRRS